MKQKNNSIGFFNIVYTVLLCCLLISCGTSKKINTDYLYFKEGKDTVNVPQKETIIQAGDLLAIQVFSRTLNQEQAAIFNIPATAVGQTQSQGYQVTQEGNIEMPVIGNIKAVGLTKRQLETSLVQKLTEYVKNPSVLIRFLQFNINVLGEVRSPGTQKFQVDRVTIIDALGAAGDLTDYGRRENVTVIREESGRKVYYTIDLRKRNFFESQVYLLQPNDIVYVSPNKFKLKSLNVDPDSQRRTGLFFSIISIILGVGTFIITAIR